MSPQPVSGELYARVQHFYARQMQALDEWRFKEYADLFTEDGVFEHTPGRPAARTRPGIVAELDAFHEQFTDDPMQRRHWFDQMAVDEEPDGTLRTTVYALIVKVRPGEQPEIGPSCVVHDELVRSGEDLLVRSRRVTYDHRR